MNKEIKGNIKYYLQQLLPLTYRATYYKQENRKYFCIWNMWFGKSFNIEEYEIKE